MGRPRIPSNIHEVRGSYKKNPSRRRTAEPRDERAIRRIRGALDTEVKAYNSLVKASIPGVLVQADSLSVWLAAKLIVKIDSGEYFAADVGTLVKLLTQFGMTPSSRAGLSVPQPKAPNRFAED